jgi:REP element-mobilizing transposase RayT
MKQLNLFKNQTPNTTIHGGSRTAGKRKNKRPLSTKHAIHLVLKSKKAIGQQSFFKHQEKIHSILNKYSKKHGVQIQDSVNMGNHIHLKIKITTREHFKNFLRTVTALIARVVTNAKKGQKFGKFWDALAFTRVLKSKIENLQLTGYFRANRVEKNRNYRTREKYLTEFNEWIYRLKRQRI